MTVVTRKQDAKLVIERQLDGARAEATEKTLVHVLQGMLLMTEGLANGNKMLTGRVIDEAMTNFLADLKAELGPEVTANAAALLIRNIALFLDDRRYDMVVSALDMTEIS